ncbi:MAG: hypothetical protein MUD10_00160 [Candidatus Pacebacteria bacterium]|jgi:hypothetical protein|nr:hypothetical protein [Candidatus Paceibacterota bacterium]
MEEIDFKQRIFVSVTGQGSGWRRKVRDINRQGIAAAAVFVERLERGERHKLYAALLRSSIKSVPLVHLRHDADASEIDFFINKFKTKFFNVHESNFDILSRWQGYWDKLYLEMNYDDRIAANVDVSKIGGFCVDLAHLKAAISRGAGEAFYILSRKGTKVSSNHLGGYSQIGDHDVHFVKDMKDFNYLSSLPKGEFGEVIALEVDNNITDQLKFKERVAAILNNYFSKT